MREVLRRRFWLHALLSMGLVLATVATKAATLTSPGVTLVVPDDRQADPGEIVTYSFLLTNNTSGNASFQVSFRSDPDWPVLGDAGTILVGPGEEAVIPLSVIVPSDAPAGAEQRLELLLTWNAGVIRAAVTTRVNPRHDFSLGGPSPTAASPGATVNLPFVLTNQGNTADTYEFEATSANAWPLSFAKASLTLGPNETRTIQILLTIPSRVPEGTGDVVTLMARSESTKTQREAKAQIKAGQPVTDGFAEVGEDKFKFLGEVGLSALDDDSMAGESEAWLHLTGSPGPDRRLELLVTGQDLDNGLGLTDSFLLYQAPLSAGVGFTTRSTRLK